MLTLLISTVAAQLIQGWILYSATLDEQKERMRFAVHTSARFLEAAARIDASYSTGGHPMGAHGATLSHVYDAWPNIPQEGHREELVLGQDQGDGLRILAHKGGVLVGKNLKIPFKSELAEPMRRALRGESGTIIAKDYRGATVLAAYEPIQGLGLGLVMKVDVDDLRSVFLESSWFIGVGTFVLVGAGIVVMLLILHPVVRRLEESRTTMSEAQKLVKLGSWEWDTGTDAVWLSDEASRRFGLEPGPEPIPRAELAERVHPQDREKFISAGRIAAQTRGAYRSDYRVIMPDGALHQLLDRGESVDGDSRKGHRIRGAVMDITEDRWAAEAILEKDSEFRLLLNSMAAGVYGLDLDGNCTFANASCLRLLGYEQMEQLLSNNVHELIHHARPDGTPFPIDECEIHGTSFEGEESRSAEDYLWRADGTGFHAERWCYPMRRDGRVIGSVVTFIDITEAYRARREQRFNERLLRTFFDTVPHWLFLKDKERRFIVVNAGYAEFFNLTPEDFVGKRYEEIIGRNPGDANLVMAADQKVIDGRQAEHISHNMWLPDGSLMIRSVHKLPFIGNSGEVEGLVGISEDVTAMHNAQRELAKSQRLLQAVFDSTPVGISVKDSQARYLMINREFADIFEVDPESIQGKNFAELGVGGGEHNESLDREDRSVLETGQEINVPRSRVVRSDGEERWRSRVKAPLLDDDGKVQGVVTVVSDITAEVYAEQALLESRTTLQLAQSISQAGIWVLNMKTDEMVWSEEVYQIFGAEPTASAPNLESYYRYAHPEDRNFVQQELEKAIQTREDFAIKHRIMRNTNVVGYVEQKARVFYGDGGEPERMVGVIEDISEQMRTLAELQDYSTRLLQSNRELENFATVAAHDLQEPLRKISLFSDRMALRTKGEIGGEARELVERIQSTAERMHKLVEGILSFSRVGAGNRPYAKIALGIVLNDVLENMDQAMENSGARLEIGDMPSIECIGVEIGLLFQNLIGNSIKYCQQGTAPVIRIEASLISPDLVEGSGLYNNYDYCQINVEDNGIGFDDKYKSKIFGMFQRLHHRGEYEGTGIGLAICQRIVTNHGGAIFATSTLGKGSTFRIILPYRQQQKSGQDKSLSENFDSLG